jgi:hypothetical protein
MGGRHHNLRLLRVCKHPNYAQATPCMVLASPTGRWVPPWHITDGARHRFASWLFPTPVRVQDEALQARKRALDSVKSQLDEVDNRCVAQRLVVHVCTTVLHILPHTCVVTPSNRLRLRDWDKLATLMDRAAEVKQLIRRRCGRARFVTRVHYMLSLQNLHAPALHALYAACL